MHGVLRKFEERPWIAPCMWSGRSERERVHGGVVDAVASHIVHNAGSGSLGRMIQSLRDCIWWAVPAQAASKVALQGVDVYGGRTCRSGHS